MNDSSLIRRENLRSLGLQPKQLAETLGASRQHWSNVLRGKSSFGEVLARSIEEGLGMPRGALDDPGLPERIQKDGLSLLANVATGTEDASLSDERIPTAMAYSPANLSSTILLLGSLLGALDQRSRRMIGMLLTDLAESPDDAQDVADKASALATTQRAMTKNKALNKALTTNKEAFSPTPEE